MKVYRSTDKWKKKKKKTGKRPQNTQDIIKLASQISESYFVSAAVITGEPSEKNKVGSIIYTSTRMSFKWIDFKFKKQGHNRNRTKSGRNVFII